MAILWRHSLNVGVQASADMTHPLGGGGARPSCCMIARLVQHVPCLDDFAAAAAFAFRGHAMISPGERWARDASRRFKAREAGFSTIGTKRASGVFFLAFVRVLFYIIDA